MQHISPVTVPTSLASRMRAWLLGAWQQGRPTQRFGYLIGTASRTRPARSGRAGRAPEPPGAHTAPTPGAAGQQVSAKDTLKDHRWPVELVVADAGGSSQQDHRHCHQSSHHRENQRCPASFSLTDQAARRTNCQHRPSRLVDRHASASCGPQSGFLGGGARLPAPGLCGQCRADPGRAGPRRDLGGGWGVGVGGVVVAQADHLGISCWRPHSWLRPRSPPSLLTTATHPPPKDQP
jgi:hypothetical protein